MAVLLWRFAPQLAHVVTNAPAARHRPRQRDPDLHDLPPPVGALPPTCHPHRGACRRCTRARRHVARSRRPEHRRAVCSGRCSCWSSSGPARARRPSASPGRCRLVFGTVGCVMARTVPVRPGVERRSTPQPTPRHEAGATCPGSSGAMPPPGGGLSVQPHRPVARRRPGRRSGLHAPSRHLRRGQSLRDPGHLPDGCARVRHRPADLPPVCPRTPTPSRRCVQGRDGVVGRSVLAGVPVHRHLLAHPHASVRAESS